MLTTVVSMVVMAQFPTLDAAQVRKDFKADELTKGAYPRKIGVTLEFAAEVKGAKSVDVMVGSKTLLHLTDLGNGIFGGFKTMADGDGMTASYVVDGKTILRGGMDIEVYQPRPYLELPASGYRGTFKSLGQYSAKMYPGTNREIWIYLPPNLDKNKEYPLLIGCDGQWDRGWMSTSLDNLIAWGKIPPTVGVFIQPGGRDGKLDNSNRNREYDTLTDEYARFIHDEIIPMVEKEAKISPDPAKRALSGLSSGGICSFTACWEHPEWFGNVLSFIGSYTALSYEGIDKSGVTYPGKIRRTDKKPIRVFLQDGRNDLDNPYGRWFLSNEQMVAALEWKGYDVSWHPGNGFHSGDNARAIYDQALGWWLDPLGRGGW